MAKSKFYNLDTDTTLGGNNASDIYIASQKAVKSYVDLADSGKADVDLSNITSIAPILGMLQTTDNSKVGYVYAAHAQNTALYTPAGGKWLILSVGYILSSNAVQYFYLDQGQYPGMIVDGGTLILQARSGYISFIAAIKVE